MSRTPNTLLKGFVVVLLALVSLLPSMASASEIAYCSSQNTGADSPIYTTDWQSNGYCSGKCSAAYAYAVINYKDCWCSNYAPQVQDSKSDCDGSCPGFPSETCGSNAGDRFVYLAMGNKPSGTKGSPQPTSSKPSSATPSPVSTAEPQRDPQTLIRTVTASAPAAASSTSTLAPSSATTLVTSASSASAVPSVTSARLLIISGQIITETVLIPNPSSAPTQGVPSQEAPIESKSSTNVGAIAGGVVGGVFVLLAIVGGILFFLWRRRCQPRDDDDDQSGVRRNISTMSKAGLLRSEKPAHFPPAIVTDVNKRNSRSMMHDADSISPISGSDRRNSRPIIFDQRLNPSAIMTFDNLSQGSIVSMDDSRDYGRTLNVRNPDPEPRD